MNLEKQLLHNRETADSNRKRERLEELYVDFGHWLNKIETGAMTLSSVMAGELTYNQHLDQIIDSAKEAKHDFQRIGLIIEVYAFDLMPSYKEVITARDELNSIADEFKREHENSGGGDHFYPSFEKAAFALHSKGTEFQQEIANACRA